MDPEYIKQMTEMVSLPIDKMHDSFSTHVYEGVPLHLTSLISTMIDLKTLQIRQDDVFVVSFPKTGTTWTLAITSAVLHDGDMERLNQFHTMIRVPFLEECPRPHKVIELLPKSSPRLIKSHLPGQLLPPQVWEKKVKIVYVIRNPKDAIVSYFKFGQMLSPSQNYDFDEIFQRFMKGTNPYGKWWEHYLYYWERRNEDHILFLRFEDMKKDLRGTVKRVSEFLGKSFSDEIIDAITDHCTFESMKKNPMTNPDTILKSKLEDGYQKGETFMRKGNVGSWKEQLSNLQSEAIDALCKDKLDGTGLCVLPE